MNSFSTKSITFRYALALGLIALLCTSAYIILYRIAASQKDTAATINISGSQRWLSQRAAVYSLRLVNSRNKTERERIRQELLQISIRMERQQDGLIHGDSSMSLSGSPSPQVLAMYFNPPLLLDKQIRSYAAEIHALAHDTDDTLTRNNPHLRNILTASASKLIKSMDAVVKQYQTECEASSIRLQTVEKGILCFTLFTLFMEAFFIFRPMISRIRRDTLKLVHSEAYLRSTIDNAMDGIITLNEHGSVESFNAAAEKMFGYTSSGINGKHIRILMPEFYYNYLHNYLWIDKEKIPHLMMCETKGKRKDGASFPLDTSLGGMRIGEQRQFVIIARDITERKQAAENLKRSEEKFRLLAESSQDGILAYDKDIRYTFWNKAMERITGVTSKEVLGKSPFEIFPFLEEVGEGDSYRETIKGKTIKSSAIPYSIPQTGRYGYFESSRFPLYDTKGTIIGGMAIIQDSTERVQTEQRLNAEHAVTRILSESATLHEASQKILQVVCECLKWDFGGIWMIDRKAGVLRCEEIWHVPSLEAKEFTAVTRQMTFSPGIGLPGRIQASAKPTWIVNVVHDTNFPRAPVAAKEGLHAAFGFPILEGNDVIGIVEFFSSEIREPDTSLLGMMGALGSQIGQFIKRKEAEHHIVKLSQAIKQSPSTVVITNAKGNIEYVNPKFTQLTGYMPEEVIGKNPRILKSGEILQEEYKRLWAVITSGGEWRGELRNRKKNGECYWEHAVISSIKNSEGAITHFLAVKEDITERKRLQSHLEYMANHDPLTNLFNRRQFQEKLEDWIAQAERYDCSGALLFLDLDNFKYINDTLGHQTGDDLLINFAYLLRTRVRETDVLARLGGDEFAIILPYTDADRARSFAMQILKLVKGNLPVGNGKLHTITVSIGIVLFPKHGNDAERLLTYADMAMYTAKEKGRDGFCFYSPDNKIQFKSRLDWQKRIQDALQNNRFVLHLQPILNIQHNKIFGYEVLLRMIDENDTLIFPPEFLNIAECFGLIYEIDRWVVRRAIRLVAEQRFDKRGLFLEVNLSGRAFNDPELLPLIKQEFEETGINPETLIFEITETAAIENMADAQRFITTLKSIGCRFGLDDFGIGFSSFSYLKHLSVDYLKIDGSFIRELNHNQTDQHLVKAMVTVARGLGKQTVAEFVECEETVQLLSKYGIDYAQGYHIGKPSAVSEISAYLQIQDKASLAPAG
ncbi:MAG: EAL domain-containing protein [Planctomycetes bacterium]|nr:EAL domain-containing protein [Planctomycetota bacterium]